MGSTPKRGAIPPAVGRERGEYIILGKIRPEDRDNFQYTAVNYPATTLDSLLLIERLPVLDEVCWMIR